LEIKFLDSGIMCFVVKVFPVGFWEYLGLHPLSHFPTFKRRLADDRNEPVICHLPSPKKAGIRVYILLFQFINVYIFLKKEIRGGLEEDDSSGNKYEFI